MALGRALSVSLVGANAEVVEVVVDVATGLPGFTLSAISDRVLTQMAHRIRSAVSNSREAWPSRKITVALSPATVPRAGSAFDLPVTCALLAAAESVPVDRLHDLVLLGELGIDGSVRPITGVLPAVIGAVRCGHTRFAVPRANLREARLVPGADVVGFRHLAELCAWLRGEVEVLPEDEPTSLRAAAVPPAPDFADVLGQERGRRVMEVAAAGAHHVFLGGPPGVGKTMLAERLPGLLPDLTPEEALEVTAMHSLVGSLPPDSGLLVRPPYCAPHHTSSTAAVVGGGQRIAAPGLISRAHRGVLFLDEAPEFARPVLDALRQPLETGQVTIARAGAVVTYPCRFLLVLAANPCPCVAGGQVADPSLCTCNSVTKRNYLSRLSGPLRDRIDLVVDLEPVSRAVLTEGAAGESTAAVRARVEAARGRARQRLRGTPWSTVGEIPGPTLRRRWPISAAAMRPLLTMVDHKTLSTRGYDRVLRVAWTIADLAGHDRPTADDVEESWALRGGKWSPRTLQVPA
ncbi:MAG TPA: YifB family Mg chelatase-like AAA ATPase [Mycobacteriales bacterium]|nr:YifB family Mg chelatase-like AAA ATPase [Mycobacteriales bacterium]